MATLKIIYISTAYPRKEHNGSSVRREEEDEDDVEEDQIGISVSLIYVLSNYLYSDNNNMNDNNENVLISLTNVFKRTRIDHEKNSIDDSTTNGDNASVTSIFCYLLISVRIASIIDSIINIY